MYSLELLPGEIICFHGSLIHAGGKNANGAMRLHWYAAPNLGNIGIPDNVVEKIPIECDEDELPPLPKT